VPPAPEPSFAERARTLVHLARTGALATHSRHRPGQPFVSLMPYAPDARGRPLFLISRMALHTQNLAADPRASLLVSQPGREDDPLAAGRVTLLGAAVEVDGAAPAAARTAYLARHPRSAHWVDFEDFGFWRLEVAEAWLVAGFGAMDWVTGAAYAAAAPDPLADAAEGILAHMNRDHREALLTLARARADAGVEEAELTAVDRLGFKLRLRSGARLWSARLGFPAEVRTPEACRQAFIEVLRAARETQALPGGRREGQSP
jgi:hypothetical protein